MAVNIVVAIGGTGSRGAEAFVYAAATGLLHNSTRTHIFIVDKDINCGNTQRLDSTIAEYSAMRECTGLDMPIIEKHNWCIEEAMAELNRQAGTQATYRQVAVKPGTSDAYLVDLMHSPEEQSFNLEYGFYGHPSLGAAIYGLITNTDAFKNDSTNQLMQTVRRELRDGNAVHVFLLGSVFGGTGASLFPNVARSLQKAFGDDPNFKQAGGLMLPYFTFETRTADGRRAQVSPDEFLEKTATALHHYANDGKLVRTDNLSRSDPSHRPAVFDDLYLLGLTPLEPTCHVYAEGGGDQTHSFSIADLYVALAAVEFFNDEAVTLPVGAPHLYSADLPTKAINWQQLPNLEVRSKAEQMVRFCEAFLSVLYPMFLQPNRELERYVFLRNLYGTVGNLFTGQRAALPADYDFAQTVEQIAPFCLHYMRFWQDLQNRQDIPVNLFTATLNQMTTYVSDEEGKPNPRDWFFNNYRTLLTEVFKPNDLLMEPRRVGIDDALGLQQRLNQYPLDRTNYHDLQPIYRAAYDIMQ